MAPLCKGSCQPAGLTEGLSANENQRFMNCYNPSVTPTACHLPLHKGGCFCPDKLRLFALKTQNSPSSDPDNTVRRSHRTAARSNPGPLRLFYKSKISSFVIAVSFPNAVLHNHYTTDAKITQETVFAKSGARGRRLDLPWFVRYNRKKDRFIRSPVRKNTGG